VAVGKELPVQPLVRRPAPSAGVAPAARPVRAFAFTAREGFDALALTPSGTRKMVNYARAGRSQAKAWWRPAVVLTCKSLIGLGYRGERLIEPSGSWFPPKFPSG